jgi:glycosyltransferase involved in cell wall biosynthesis
MLLSRELHIPFVVTVHGLDVFFMAQVKGYAGQCCRRVALSVYRAAVRVICISRRVADELVNGGVADAQVKVIHNGVDPERFSPGQGTCERPNILSVGTLIPSKGHELLLRAFAVLHERYPNLWCDIIGDGPERSRLAGLARDLSVAGKVRFLGRQSRKQVAEAMRRCTVFALPSRYEGLGCVYLEAMSAEKPAIACRGQGIEDVIQHGQTGWLVDPDDFNAMTKALFTLLEAGELRRRIGLAARNSILRGYTVRHQAARQLYRECLA